MLRDTRIPVDGSSFVHADLKGLSSDDHKQYALTTGAERAEIVINTPSTHQILVLDSTSGLLFNSDEFGISRITYINDIQFDPKITDNFPNHQEGKVFYDVDSHALAYYNEQSDVTIQIGQETVVRVRNMSGGPINNGQSVYISGSNGQTPTIELAQADSDNTFYAIGLVTHNLENGDFGYATVRGIVRNIYTDNLIEGLPVYLSPDTPGGLTSVKPTSPDYCVCLGICAYKHPVHGKILVNVAHAGALSNLSDIQITNPQDGEILVYDSTAGYWYNTVNSGGSGTSGTSGTSGISGTSGSSGTSGINGTSGSSGLSGTSGSSGSSGTSGVTPNIYIDSTSGDVYFYDPVRDKNLGVGLLQQSAGRNHTTVTNQFLRGEGDTPTNLNGFVLPYNATLVTMSMSGELNTQSWSVEVRKNGGGVSQATLSITNQYSNYIDGLNVDFNAGDRIMIYCNGTAISYPHADLIFRRRF
jgi:hypothetical protein